MKIEIPDEIALKAGIESQELLELLAVAIYKTKGIHASMAGKILGISEFEFRKLLTKHGETSNYDVGDFAQDVKDNDL
jgi:predicted HTH domain antitoxin